MPHADPTAADAATEPSLLRLANHLDAVNRLVGRLVAWLALAMVLLQFVIVLARHVFGVSAIAVDESVLYLHATVFMLGAGYTYLIDGHVRVDIFYAKLSARGQALVDVLGTLFFLLPALALLLYWSFPMVRRSWAMLEGPISVGGIPASFLLKSLVPAFCVLLAVQGIARLLRDLVRLSGGSGAKAGPGGAAL